MTRRAVLRRLAGTLDFGPAAQALVPGLYAWGVTVAPVALARGVPPGAVVSAFMGVAAVVAAVVVERARPRWARALSLWGLTLGSAIVWMLAPPSVLSARVGGWRTVVGMLAWALFALIAAAPAPPRGGPAEQRVVPATALRPRVPSGPWDRACVTGAMAVALAYQLLCDPAAGPERGIAQRLVATVAGIAILGGATSVAGRLSSTDGDRSLRAAARRALPFLVGMLLVGTTLVLAPR